MKFLKAIGWFLFVLVIGVEILAAISVILLGSLAIQLDIWWFYMFQGAAIAWILFLMVLVAVQYSKYYNRMVDALSLKDKENNETE